MNPSNRTSAREHGERTTRFRLNPSLLMNAGQPGLPASDPTSGDCSRGRPRSSKLSRFFLTSFAAALLSLPAGLDAHPGHALGERGILHVMTSPYHLVVLAFLGVGLWSAALLVEKKVPRRTLQTLGVLVVLAATALWGLRA